MLIGLKSLKMTEYNMKIVDITDYTEHILGFLGLVSSKYYYFFAGTVWLLFCEYGHLIFNKMYISLWKSIIIRYI